MVWFVCVACLPALFVVGGLATVGFGAVRVVRAFRFSGRAVRAEGVVTGLVSEEYGGRRSRHLRSRPVLTFRTPDDAEITATGFEVTRRPVGEEVPVLYDPAAPDRARIAGNGPLLAGLGTAAVGVSVAALSATALYLLVVVWSVAEAAGRI